VKVRQAYAGDDRVTGLDCDLRLPLLHRPDAAVCERMCCTWDRERLGLLMGLSAIGGLTGAVGLVGIPRSQRRAALFVAVTAITFGAASLGFAHRFAVAVGSLVVLGLGVSTLAG